MRTAFQSGGPTTDMDICRRALQYKKDRKNQEVPDVYKVHFENRCLLN